MNGFAMNNSDSRFSAVHAEVERIRAERLTRQQTAHKEKSRLALEWAKLCRDGDDRRKSQNRKESA